MNSLTESLLRNAGISKKSMIEKWLTEMYIKNYTINSDLTIDVDRDVILSGKKIMELPSYIQFNEINGSFNCTFCDLTSLRGCPKKVNGFFNCSHNNLETLEYCPEEIKYWFACSYNKLISLDGIANIKRFSSLYVDNNKLENLKYLPEKINGDFNCSNNKLKNLKGAPRYIMNNFNCSHNDLESLEGCPKRVEGEFIIICDKKISKEDVLKYCKVNPKKIHVEDILL